MAGEDSGPGTWRVADGSAVEWADALGAWTTEADRYLRERVTGYGFWVTYADLAEHVQAAAGIRTRTRLHHWIGKVLGRVADAQADGEPMLTSLVVTTAAHEVGPGYREAVERTEGGVPEDLQAHAAQSRLECYRFFGAAVPDGGGTPHLPPKVVAARARSAPEPKREVCPVCRMRKSLAGTCDCD